VKFAFGILEYFNTEDDTACLDRTKQSHTIGDVWYEEDECIKYECVALKSFLRSTKITSVTKCPVVKNGKYCFAYNLLGRYPSCCPKSHCLDILKNPTQNAMEDDEDFASRRKKSNIKCRMKNSFKGDDSGSGDSDSSDQELGSGLEGSGSGSGMGAADTVPEGGSDCELEGSGNGYDNSIKRYDDKDAEDGGNGKSYDGSGHEGGDSGSGDDGSGSGYDGIDNGSGTNKVSNESSSSASQSTRNKIDEDSFVFVENE